MNLPTLSALIFLTGLPISVHAFDMADPYLWLEEVESDKALTWVRERNAVSQKELEAAPEFAPIYQRLLSIYDSDARIPDVIQQGAWLYNFWRDAQHPRGIWRRTTLVEYRKLNPAWETVLDLDALSAQENENWVWKGADCLYPEYTRCLLSLSRGGADAHVIREFDTFDKRFVKNGFWLVEAKHEIAWRNFDSVLVATDFGAGSFTASGYPRIVKEWTRGTPIASARTIYEAGKADVGVSIQVFNEPARQREVIQRAISFFEYEHFLRSGDHLAKLEVPADAEISLFKDQLLLQLRSPWRITGRAYPSGSLIAIPLVSFIEGNRAFEVLFVPSAQVSLNSYDRTRNGLLLNLLDKVRGRVLALRYDKGRWTRTEVAVPEFGEASARALDPDRSDDYFVTVEDFLHPTRLLEGSFGRSTQILLKQLPDFFQASGLEIVQREALSKDGTRIPYFQVGKPGLKVNGSNPTLLYGYGGFEIPMTPRYRAGVGAAWLERGGVFALANIRGGGEFGPQWHQAAVQENRQRAYDDFAAVAEDLIRRGVTSPKHLGIQGGSNGGLLVGVAMTQRPDLFGAVVSQVPLLDMRRYNQLLAGASWMSEYGNPDLPAHWAFISRYSPYQNARKNVRYPPILLTTSTRDDRVHPAHARKMTARLLEQGHRALYYENIEGGHGGAANNRQRAYMDALAYVFLLRQLR
ncbi:MAG: prolyl oligopeptidase family serine peptidase [Panacagrimonas sp.]